MSNGDSGMEFLRFGSSIPGNYWGCCAADIIQNFKVDPDAKASIQLTSGDGGGCLMKDGEMLFAGPTYRDIFHQRLRIGTFSSTEMPNHAFFAIMSRSQLFTDNGKKWLSILKEAGFEFLRKVNNSVWNVDNFIFVLIRNAGKNFVSDQFTPPKEWTALPDVVPEAWQFIEDRPGLTMSIRKKQKPLYDALPLDEFLKESEIVVAGAPVILAGLRSEYHRPQPKDVREKLGKEMGKTKTVSLKDTPALPSFAA